MGGRSAQSEVLRLEALAGYAVLDSEPEPAFDELARLTAAIFRTPMAAVSLVDDVRQWFKAQVGLECAWTPRGDGMCESVVSDRAPIVVEDLTTDARFAHRQMVVGAPFLRFYAGAPLIASDGQVLGALCVIDTAPRTFTSEQVDILTGLAAQVMAQLELRVANARGRAHATDLARSEARARQLLDATPDAVLVLDGNGRIEQSSTQVLELFGYTADELVGTPVEMLVPAALHGVHQQQREHGAATAEPQPRTTGPDVVAVRKDGSTVPVEVNLGSVDLAGGRAVLASIRDVSDSRALQRELGIARDRFRDVLNGAVGQAIIGTDLEGRITVFSEGASRILGYPELEMLGRTPEILHDRAEIAARATELGIEPGFEVFVHTTRTGSPDTREWTYVTADGRRLNMLLTVTSVLDSGGEPTGFIGVATDISERQIVQRHLADSEQRFRLAFDDSRAGMAQASLRAGKRGRFLRVNTALCRMLGYSEDELLARTFIDLTHPDDRVQTQETLQAMTTGELGSWERDKRYVHADGRTIWMHVAVAVFHDGDGSPAYTIAQMHDISERVASTAELQGRFQDLATNVDLGFTIRRVDSREFQYVNPAFFTVFGLDPLGPSLTTADLLALQHPDDVAAVTRLVATLGKGAVAELESRIVRPDVGVRWIRTKSFPILTGDDPDTADQRVASIFEDVTVRKNAESEVVASQERFDQLARSTEVGFFLRTATEILYMNDSLLTIFGADPGPTNPSVAEIMQLIHPEDVALARDTTATADRGEHTRADLRIVRPDGQTRWIRVTNDPVVGTEGEPRRVAGTITDVTDYKNAELAVLDAQRRAEEASAAKDEFLSRMSHELRTPLNAVLGFAQLLEFDAATLSSSQNDGVGHILRGGRHLLAMINDLLDITSIEANHLELSVAPVDANHLATDVVGLMQPVAGAHQVSLHLDLLVARRECWLRADHRRLRQVLINLLSNAIKYNHPGGRAGITVARLDDELTFAVTDTGIGIPAEDIPKLYSPFERLGRQRTDIEGSGIGLALTKRLVTVMGGRLDVTSAIGEGTTFTVTLPLIDAPDDPADDLDLPAESVPTDRVLYIEDNPSNRDLLSSAITRRPHWSVTLAATGQVGLALAWADPPSAVVLDLDLPDIDGAEVLQLLKSTPATADIPVAILSADASSGQITRLLAAGAERYLTKPLDLTELFDFLDAHDKTATTAVTVVTVHR